MEHRPLSWQKKTLLYLAAFSLLCLIALLSGEVLARVFLPSHKIEVLRQRSLLYSPAIITRFTLNPNQTVKLSRDRVFTINAYGYRGTSFAVEKPDEVIRIVVLGGSAVFDQNVSDGYTWPSLLEKALQARGYTNVEVLNAGVPGYTSFDAVGSLYARIWMVKPDYVLLYNAWNDIKYFKALSPETPLSSWRPQAYPIVDPRLHYRGFLDKLLGFSELYAQLRVRYYQYTLQVGAEGVVSDSPYADTYSPWSVQQYKLTLQWFVDLSRNIGATPILLTQASLVHPGNTPEERERIGMQYQKLSYEALVQAYQACNRTIKTVAEEKDAQLVDLDAMLTGQGALFSDHVHLTAKGGQRVAHILATFLANALRQGNDQGG